MKPVIFEILGVEIYGYGLMIALGIIAALGILFKLSRDKGYNEDKVFNMALISIILGVLGGKILFIITEFKNIINNPYILKDFGAGFVIYGAIMGGAIGVYAYCRKQRWNVLKVLDIVVPGVAIAQGFGRIGCLLAGCCYGAPTALPWGITFHESPFAVNEVSLHPTQVYSSLFDFALGIFLLWSLKEYKKPGKTFSLYVILYSIGRFLVEFLRNDPRGNVGVLSTSQFIAIFTLIIGIVVFNIDKLKGRRVTNEEK